MHQQHLRRLGESQSIKSNKPSCVCYRFFLPRRPKVEEKKGDLLEGFFFPRLLSETETVLCLHGRDIEMKAINTHTHSFRNANTDPTSFFFDPSLRSETTAIRRCNGLATDRGKADSSAARADDAQIEVMEIGSWVKWIG